MKISPIVLLLALIAIVAAVASAETRTADVQHARVAIGAYDATRVAAYWTRLIERKNLVATITAASASTVQVTSDDSEVFSTLERAVIFETWL
eukprot:EC718655.1.p2 GENE.EC718655.1~~EC718655.1.p2  ORF type:complete len:93 (+),score=20.23 EC718655.1:54-332(+)